MAVEKPFLVPSNVCPIVPLVFLKANCRFEFVDICERTLCMDESIAIAKLKHQPDGYAGVLFVRSYGVMTPVDTFFKAIKEIREDLIVIDDRCLSVPDFHFEVQRWHDITLYSTGYSKFADIGFGGYAQIKDDHHYVRHQTAFAERDLNTITAQYKGAIERRQSFAYVDSDWLETSPPKISFPSYQKEVENKISEVADWKEAINRVYAEKIPRSIQLAPEYQLWRFNILVPAKEQLLSQIRKSGLFASSHYASLDGIFSDGRSATAEKVHTRIVNLFNDKYFDIERAHAIAEIVNAHLEKYIN